MTEQLSASVSEEYDPRSYDPTSPDVKENVEEHFANLREKCPVHRHKFSDEQLKALTDNPFVTGQGDEFYTLTRYRDVEECLVNTDKFLSAEGSGPERIAVPENGGSLAWSDGAAHKRSRRLAQPAVAPKVIAPLVPMLQERIDDLIDELASKGRADIMVDFAIPLTSGMLTHLLGLPTEMESDVKEWALAILSIWGGTEEAAQRGANAMAAMSETVAKVGPALVAGVERGEREPCALSMLLSTTDENDKLYGHDEVVQAFVQMIAGGFESSATAIANGVYLFCRNPGERRKLLEQPELINTAVEEVLRYMAPIEGLARTTSQDLAIGGVHMSEGTKVRATFASANMDDEVFDDPTRFKIDRSRAELQKHLSFGKGPHTCIGNNLARQELRLAFATLFRRIPTLELDPAGAPTRSKVMVIHGFDHLPVMWDPASVLPRDAS
jgi:cytochrome P450